MNNPFIEYEKIHGAINLIKVIISTQNKILIEKGITTEKELITKLKKELIKPDTKNKFSSNHSNKLKRKKTQ
jgi:hypothetical protein